MSLDPRAALYRAFEVYPLEPHDPAYVNCEAVREVYRKTIYGNDWTKLAEVWLTKSISKDNQEAEYRDLLFRRCVLEYRRDDAGNIIYSHDVHPLIEGMAEFRAAVEIVQHAGN